MDREQRSWRIFLATALCSLENWALNGGHFPFGLKSTINKLALFFFLFLVLVELVELKISHLHSLPQPSNPFLSQQTGIIFPTNMCNYYCNSNPSNPSLSQQTDIIFPTNMCNYYCNSNSQLHNTIIVTNSIQILVLT